MIDAVLSVHTNPATCGVAKFSAQLAKRLNVPFAALDDAGKFTHPLLSLKGSELSAEHEWTPVKTYDLFLHDATVADSVIEQAQQVYAGNPVIARTVRLTRPDVIEAWCPATIDGNPTRTTFTVLTFGMAGRLQLQQYRKLKTLLDASGKDYTVSLSTAVHEGSPWETVAEAGADLRAIFGFRLRELGYLADDALARELRECSAIALFFHPAVRANNTTFWAAVETGKPIITNADADSPALPYPQVAWDIDTLTQWPRRVNREWPVTTEPYSWDRLVALMGVGVEV